MRPLDDARLRDAVRIYTRDVKTEPPATGRERLTLWYEGTASPRGGVTVTLYVLAPGQEAKGIERISGAPLSGAASPWLLIGKSFSTFSEKSPCL